MSLMSWMSWRLLRVTIIDTTRLPLDTSLSSHHTFWHNRLDPALLNMVQDFVKIGEIKMPKNTQSKSTLELKLFLTIKVMKSGSERWCLGWYVGMSKNSAGGCLIFRQSAIADHLDADASTLIASGDQCQRCAQRSTHPAYMSGHLQQMSLCWEKNRLFVKVDVWIIGWSGSVRGEAVRAKVQKTVNHTLARGLHCHPL